MLMRSFVVLTIGKDLHTHELEIALRSFAFMVAKVTPKHRKALRLRLVGDSQQRMLLTHLIQRFELTKYVEWSSPYQTYFTDCHLMFSPTLQLDSVLVQHSLEAGVPVLTYDNSRSEQHIDSSCGVLIPYRSGERAAQTFSDYLRMLYFDPEAQRFLKKGAIRRSQRQPIMLPAAALSLAS